MPASIASAWPTPSVMPIPAMVQSLFEQALPIAGERLNCGHFHDTRGLGLANVFAAWQTGITASMPAWPASAAARMRRARAATSRPKTSPTCLPAWACRPARTSTS